MTILALVITVSLGVSFACSVLEAVLLAVTHGYVALLEEQDDPAGALLARLRARIDEPIAAICTLNTIAHTVGAALSGAIALHVLGSRRMAAFWAVLTLPIPVLPEIIPKTLGARHWRRLAPLTARIRRAMLVAMKPILAPLAVPNRLVGASGDGGARVSRTELEVLAEVGRREGQIDDTEWRVVSNGMRLRDRTVGEVMTPRTSMVALPEASTAQEAQALIAGYRIPATARVRGHRRPDHRGARGARSLARHAARGHVLATALAGAAVRA
jgi:CBS domain containing-hemolysin-like protein